jgi:hypothetical protein
MPLLFEEAFSERSVYPLDPRNDPELIRQAADCIFWKTPVFLGDPDKGFARDAHFAGVPALLSMSV